MKTATKIVDVICKVFGYLAAFCLIFMMLYTTFDVVDRTVTGTAMIGTTEVMSYVFCLMLYAGYGYVQRRHGHLHVTIITELMPGKGKYIMWAITSWIGSAVLLYVAYATYTQSMKQIAKGVYTAMLRIPYQPMYVLCIAGMTCFAIAVIFDAIRATLAIFSESYAGEIADENFITTR